jgi:hypothetical protein
MEAATGLIPQGLCTLMISSHIRPSRTTINLNAVIIYRAVEDVLRFVLRADSCFNPLITQHDFMKKGDINDATRGVSLECGGDIFCGVRLGGSS